MLMVLADYVVNYIESLGVRHVFLMPGAINRYLADSLACRSDLEGVFCLHGQAGAIATEAYARIAGSVGVAFVGSGPAATHTVTGLAGAWLDSIPCLVVSSQAKQSNSACVSAIDRGKARDIDIVPLVAPVCKYAATILDPFTVRYHLEKAVHIATTGRPGPVWLDIPFEVLATMIDVEVLPVFDRSVSVEGRGAVDLEGQVSRSIELLNSAERPVLLAGHGIRVSGALEEFRQLIDLLDIPVTTTFPGIDLVPDSHRLFMGRPGAIASRWANFALQNSDFLLTIGARLDLATVGYSHERLARGAKKVMVDIDEAEIQKMETHIDVAAVADAGQFIREMLKQIDTVTTRPRLSWKSRCAEWKARYPVVLPQHRSHEDGVSMYVFTQLLSDLLEEDVIIVPPSAGLCAEIFFLAFEAKNGQRIFHNRGTGAMGFAIPSAIGACLGAEKKQIICIEGDGGFQLNVQELHTVKRLNLPIKIFVINNAGYASIRASQSRSFSHLVGADPTSGMTLPDTLRLAGAYGFVTKRIASHASLQEDLRQVLAFPGAIVCEVQAIPDESRSPCITSRQLPNGSMESSPLEDLWPFLDRDEFWSNMIVPPLDR